jgi:hypothetical protein
MIKFNEIRQLTLKEPSTPGRPPYLSAASGLVCIKSFMYVIADDELHLGVFHSSDHAPGSLARMFDGELPNDKKHRKKRKPDFEALALIPAFGSYPYGALFAFGSASRENRCLAALLSLDESGAIQGRSRTIDLSDVLTPLETLYPALNIEGAVVIGDELRLFQRGNKKSESAMIRYSLSAFLGALQGDRTAVLDPLAHEVFDLGQVEGIPLSFSDAASLPNGDVVFTAIAEDTDDTYLDGRCAGAAIGLIDAKGALCWIKRLEQPHKIEGIDARLDGDTINLLLVTDADDIEIRAMLYSAAVEHRG